MRLDKSLSDINEKLRAAMLCAEEALRSADAESQRSRESADLARKQLHDIVMQTPAPMVVITGQDYRFTLVNPFYERLVNRKVLGLALKEAFSPEEAEHIRPILECVFETGEAYFVKELPVYLVDDFGVVRQHFLNVSYTPLRDQSAQVTAVMCLMLDVSEEVIARQKAEQAQAELIEAQDRLELAMESAHIATWYYEFASGRVITPSETASLFGLDEINDDLFHLIDRMAHPDDRERIGARLRGSIERRCHYTDEFRIVRVDRTVAWLRATGRVRTRGGQLAMFGVVTDITDEKLRSEQVEHAKHLAESANAAKSAFLANMSHEIRTPMTAILGFTEVLKDRSLTEEEREDAIQRIDGSGRALLRLIEDVLDISKIEAGKLTISRTKFSPTEIASEVVAVLRLSADRKGVALRLIIDPSAPATACSDPARVRQILTNLVGNAVKFTLHGEVVLFTKAEDGHRLVFEVIDTGIGIAEEAQHKLFQPFAQADDTITRSFGGTGLGLVLSRDLAEMHGGSLRLIESAPGKGSRFTVQIEGAPFYSSEPARDVAGEPAQSAPIQLNGLRVLVAEDVPDNQVLMRRYLESSGATVRFAGNGQEAIERALASEFDLVLMDIQMPVLDGLKATQELRSHGYRKPIVALTAHAMAEEVARSLSAGCNAHLTKPITKQALVDAVYKHTHMPVSVS